MFKRNTMFKSLRCVYSLKERKYIKTGGRDYSKDRHSAAGCCDWTGAAGCCDSRSGAIESDDPGVDTIELRHPLKLFRNSRYINCTGNTFTRSTVGPNQHFGDIDI